MTSFQVEPSDLDSYAGQLARATSDAQECLSYFNRQVPELEPVTGGIINPLVHEHRRVRAQLASMLAGLATLLDASEAGVREAAAQYRGSDRATAARVDDSYPVVSRPSLRTS